MSAWLNTATLQCLWGWMACPFTSNKQVSMCSVGVLFLLNLHDLWLKQTDAGTTGTKAGYEPFCIVPTHRGRRRKRHGGQSYPTSSVNSCSWILFSCVVITVPTCVSWTVCSRPPAAVHFQLWTVLWAGLVGL